MSHSHLRLDSPLVQSHSRQTTSKKRARAQDLRSSFEVRAKQNNGVVILPGLGNNKQDYEPLAALLRKRDLKVEIAQVSRPDW